MAYVNIFRSGKKVKTLYNIKLQVGILYGKGVIKCENIYNTMSVRISHKSG